ncbi:hypothetical protein [Staphylospora marina]|uniref:hypothetical protein n=1 Tax=Staphylospora marina TaxID=2490858 RepID=UPI001F14D0CC|nr:hypothetical protein [Staphylospora marina]
MKALIFDFDGLIVDTETTWYQVYRDDVIRIKPDPELYLRALERPGKSKRMDFPPIEARISSFEEITPEGLADLLFPEAR